MLELTTFSGLATGQDVLPTGFCSTDNIKMTAGVPESAGEIRNAKIFTHPGFHSECQIIPANEFVAPGYTGIGEADGHHWFYYEGQKIGEVTAAEHSLAELSGKILIFPEKLYFDFASGATELSDMESALFSEFQFHTNSAGKSTVRGDVDFSECYAPGDAVAIRGTAAGNDVDPFGTDTEIASAIVTEAADGCLTVALYDKNGEATRFNSATEEATVCRPIPDIRHAAVYRNRLWGTVSTESGGRLYASAQGDPFAFCDFRGTKADSYWTDIGEGGNFMGLVPYLSTLVALKLGTLYEVRGTNARDFSVSVASGTGTDEPRSVAADFSGVYFLYRGAAYRYNGSVKKISERLSPLSGAGAAHRGDYFLATADGLIVYDGARWLCRDKRSYDSLASNGAFLRLQRGEYQGTPEILVGDGFSLTSCRVMLPYAPPTGTFQAIFTLDKGVGDVAFYADTGAGEKKIGTLTRQGLCHAVFPVRFRQNEYFRYRIEGNGRFTLYSVEVRQ